jgi:hypothetical protein
MKYIISPLQLLQSVPADRNAATTFYGLHTVLYMAYRHKNGVTRKAAQEAIAEGFSRVHTKLVFKICDYSLPVF